MLRKKFRNYLGRGRLNILSHSTISYGATYILKINSILRWARFKLSFCIATTLPIQKENPTDSDYTRYILIRYRWCLATHTIESFVYTCSLNGRRIHRLSTLNYFFRLFVLRLAAYFSSSHIKRTHPLCTCVSDTRVGSTKDKRGSASYTPSHSHTLKHTETRVSRNALYKKCAVIIEREKAVHFIRLFLA